MNQQPRLEATHAAIRPYHDPRREPVTRRIAGRLQDSRSSRSAPPYRTLHRVPINVFTRDQVVFALTIRRTSTGAQRPGPPASVIAPRRPGGPLANRSLSWTQTRLVPGPGAPGARAMSGPSSCACGVHRCRRNQPGLSTISARAAPAAAPMTRALRTRDARARELVGRQCSGGGASFLSAAPACPPRGECGCSTSCDQVHRRRDGAQPDRDPDPGTSPPVADEPGRDPPRADAQDGYIRRSSSMRWQASGHRLRAGSARMRKAANAETPWARMNRSTVHVGEDDMDTSRTLSGR